MIAIYSTFQLVQRRFCSNPELQIKDAQKGAFNYNNTLRDVNGGTNAANVTWLLKAVVYEVMCAEAGSAQQSFGIKLIRNKIESHRVRGTVK